MAKSAKNEPGNASGAPAPRPARDGGAKAAGQKADNAAGKVELSKVAPNNVTSPRKPAKPIKPGKSANATKSGKPAKGSGVTPSMAQFLEIKAANPDSILWYRMGDFYELFFEDAVVAAKALSITLTKRGKHLGEDIPMCGVPVVRADEYLQRLIRQGFRVAVCEQLEDPAEAKKRGAKSIVHRDVVRLVTPGTLTEDALLDASARNYLSALFKAPDRADGKGAMLALASMDISTGEFEVGEVAPIDLPGELLRLSPSEIIAVDQVFGDLEFMRWVEVAGAAPTPVPGAYFDSMAGERNLKQRLGVADLAAFGGFSRGELAAIGALLKYIELTQLGARPVMRPPRKTGAAQILVIDAASRASLELVRASSGDKRDSLLGAVERTVTGPGARELAARLASPLRDPQEINARLDVVSYLIDEESLREDLRASLKAAPDIARAMSRLGYNRGGPRDLAAVGDGLAAALSCAALLRTSSGAMGLPQHLAQLMQRLEAGGLSLNENGLSLHDTLKAALVEEPPHLRREGNYIAPGFAADLDDARKLRDEGRQVMAALEIKYVQSSGIKGLKLRHNNMLGYFLEATAANAKPLLQPPLNETFTHRQTLANAVRFITTELVETEGRIASAGDRALALEHEIFTRLASDIAGQEQVLSEVAAALAALDHHCGLAQVARDEDYVRPQLDGSTMFEIIGGRHPVVEQALRRAHEGPFIENDCVLGRYEPAPTGFDEAAGDDARIWLVTGPNMAGKSTFLRQNALITVLAQIGSYVPAREARIGVVDRLFSRVGASDDLARGRSTFMVEMVETAGILNQASDKSLVILDEVGRGTATFDGLSIAWATVEHLHNVNCCRSLFATHYHELTALAQRLAHVANVTVDVKEWRDEIVFLHKVRAGSADRSYGIQVAKLAGLPHEVVARASEVLQLLEEGDDGRATPAGQLDDLPLFAAARPKAAPIAMPAAGPSPSDEALQALNPDEMTPRAALEALYKLKELSRKQD